MAAKLTARQQAQLAWLETLPRKFERLTRSIEQLSGHRADETQVRTTQRYAHLDNETLSGAAGLAGKVIETMAVPAFVAEA